MKLNYTESPKVNDTINALNGTTPWQLVVEQVRTVEELEETHPVIAKYLRKANAVEELYVRKPRGKKLFLARRLESGRIRVYFDISF